MVFHQNGTTITHWGNEKANWKVTGIFFIAAKIGEASLAPGANPYALGAYKMSPLWLLGAYGVLTAGEVMLSPVGLSLVSKVAPIRWRGIMMGGWLVATGLGNKLTQIGQLWDN